MCHRKLHDIITHCAKFLYLNIYARNREIPVRVHCIREIKEKITNTRILVNIKFTKTETCPPRGHCHQETLGSTTREGRTCTIVIIKGPVIQTWDNVRIITFIPLQLS